MKRLAFSVVFAVANACWVTPGNAEEPPRVVPKVACQSLVGKSFYNVTVTDADHVGAIGSFKAYCRVRATERGTQHDLEVRLPDVWLRRYVQSGGGGFDGSIPKVSNEILSLGAVQGANNGGHRDPSGAALLNNPRAIERWAHSAILIAVRFGKTIATTYYGVAPAHSYYVGCSNGGRGALNAASKYGSEFDGIVAGAPSRNVVGQIAAWTLAGSLRIPSNTQLKAVHAAAVTKCDALDGLTDGIISNWQDCHFDPRTDIPQSVGLTAEQVASIKTLMSDLVAPNGSIVYSGYGAGDLSAGWPLLSLFGKNTMRYVILNDANWSANDFDPAMYYAKISTVADDQYQLSADVAGLTQFMREGRKIIIWHGADDTIISHRDTIRTWDQVAVVAGAGLIKEASRFYIAPGVEHCGGGEGADSIDMLTPLVHWVENKRSPSTLLAEKRNQEGQVSFSRPLCEYPGYPRYNGRGDVNKASSFSCVIPLH